MSILSYSSEIRALFEVVFLLLQSKGFINNSRKKLSFSYFFTCQSGNSGARRGGGGEEGGGGGCGGGTTCESPWTKQLLPPGVCL